MPQHAEHACCPSLPSLAPKPQERFACMPSPCRTCGFLCPCTRWPCNNAFSPQGYDLSVEPDFWPPVVDTPEGRRIVTGQQDS